MRQCFGCEYENIDAASDPCNRCLTGERWEEKNIESITFKKLNGLTPTEQSCTFKLLEEVGEVMELIGKKSKASGECVGNFEAGDLIMEHMDVAQSAVTAVMILCKKYGYDLKTVIETHELKLRERGYLK